MTRRLFLAPLAALLLLCATAVPAMALTLDDVQQMVAVGVPDNIIVSTIANSEEVFNLTAEQIIDLKKSGVSDKVIEALQATAGSGGRTTETRESEEQPVRRRSSDEDSSSRRSSSDDEGSSRRSSRSSDDDDDGYSRRSSRSSDRGDDNKGRDARAPERRSTKN